MTVALRGHVAKPSSQRKKKSVTSNIPYRRFILPIISAAPQMPMSKTEAQRSHATRVSQQ
jgi:hypothetical protein